MSFLVPALAACGNNGVDQVRTSDAPTFLLANAAVAEAPSQSATVFVAGYRRDYTIAFDNGQVTVTNQSDSNDVRKFAGIRLIKFVDRYTSLDIDGIPGQVYRLYQAAFNRKPDLTGLGFWIFNAETRQLTMEAVADGFLGSPESISLYGQSPTNDKLVAAAYANVLHRDPERAGFDWWIDAMKNGLSRQSMLYNFSESRENKDNLLPDMANGFDYAPFADMPPGTATADASVIVDSVLSSNIGFLPGANGRPAGTWHWPGTPSRHVLVYIPMPGNGIGQDYASKANDAISRINARLNGLVFLEAVNAIPTSGNYIHVSYNTAYVPPGSTNYSGYCANVSTAPYSGDPLAPDNQNGISSTPVYLNLGNGHCEVTQDIVTHEFGHALGLGNHFDGFGANGTAPISVLFWDVLATLYGNPRSTIAGDLIVKHAYPLLEPK
jgi:hypothetical protein